MARVSPVATSMLMSSTRTRRPSVRDKCLVLSFATNWRGELSKMAGAQRAEGDSHGPWKSSDLSSSVIHLKDDCLPATALTRDGSRGFQPSSTARPIRRTISSVNSGSGGWRSLPSTSHPAGLFRSGYSFVYCRQGFVLASATDESLRQSATLAKRRDNSRQRPSPRSRGARGRLCERRFSVPSPRLRGEG